MGDIFVIIIILWIYFNIWASLNLLAEFSSSSPSHHQPTIISNTLSAVLKSLGKIILCSTDYPTNIWNLISLSKMYLFSYVVELESGYQNFRAFWIISYSLHSTRRWVGWIFLSSYHSRRDLLLAASKEYSKHQKLEMAGDWISTFCLK